MFALFSMSYQVRNFRLFLLYLLAFSSAVRSNTRFNRKWKTGNAYRYKVWLIHYRKTF